jgi:hypothetical protein
MGLLCCWLGNALRYRSLVDGAAVALLSRIASEQEAALVMAKHLKAKLSSGYEAV